ncbi:MAG: type II toxin-antitoxin system VapC family toxin [Gammaproteobacteria bacterium]|nr:type II toxin-antitoxin system VapC family toxin [Gammaproteobacteria bacterium]
MELRYLLDTNICIYIAKQKPMSVLERFEQLAVGSVGMSIITYGELYYGAQKSHRTKKTKQFLEELIGLIPPLPLPIDAAKCYGVIRRQLEKKGKPIGNNDLWIAAHAMSMNLTVVTNNCKEFSRVAKLRLENWVDEK